MTMVGVPAIVRRSGVVCVGSGGGGGVVGAGGGGGGGSARNSKWSPHCSAALNQPT